MLDRGLFDAVCWLAVMERLVRIRRAERDQIERFLLMDDWRKRITGVIVMTATPSTSMEREKGDLPVVGSGGSIMNKEVLQQMLDTTRETAKRLRDQFRVFEVNTSNGSRGRKRTVERVASIVLDLIDEQLDECILRLPKDEVAAVFRGETCITSESAKHLIEIFASRGRLTSRHTVEADESVVQALPVVVVRNKSGDILRLRRFERQHTNPLHKKIVIWAGGHVRKEDGHNGDPITQCMVRELQEELRLSVEKDDLQLLGAVWIPGSESEKTRQHVAVVFEWRAKADDVAVALSATEFFERRGTSLSGTFVSAGDLATDVDRRHVSETWSVEIARRLLADVAVLQPNPRLL